VHTDQYGNVDPDAGGGGGVGESLLVKPTRLLAFDSWGSCTSPIPPTLMAVHVHTGSNTVNQEQISATDVLLF